MIYFKENSSASVEFVCTWEICSSWTLMCILRCQIYELENLNVLLKARMDNLVRPINVRETEKVSFLPKIILIREIFGNRMNFPAAKIVASIGIRSNKKVLPRERKRHTARRVSIGHMGVTPLGRMGVLPGVNWQTNWKQYLPPSFGCGR